MFETKSVYSILFLVLLALGLYFFWYIALMMAVSYLLASILEPLISAFASKMRYRNMAFFFIFTFFWSLIITLVLKIIPVIYSQSIIFIYKIPQYNSYLQQSIVPMMEKQIGTLDPEIATRVSNVIKTISDNLLSQIPSFIGNIWQSAMAIVNLVVLFILLPVTNFYFIKDHDLIKRFFKETIGSLHEGVQFFIRDCVKVFTEFAVGQLEVCMVMILYYSFFLSIAEIDLGLVLGVISGILVAAPLVGITVSLFLSVLATLVQFGIDYHLAYVMVIYFIGQILEGYIVAPKIIGDKMGLHPIVMIFSLMAWWHILGMYGLFIGLPLTSIAKDLINNLNASAKHL